MRRHGEIVVPGVLVKCEVSNKKVLPSLVERSALTGKRALKQFFVSSSVSAVRAMQDECVASATGKYCLPAEAKLCMWSGKKIHPDDLRTCELTRMNAHFEFMTTNDACRLEPLDQFVERLAKEGRQTGALDQNRLKTCRESQMPSRKSRLQSCRQRTLFGCLRGDKELARFENSPGRSVVLHSRTGSDRQNCCRKTRSAGLDTGKGILESLSR